MFPLCILIASSCSIQLQCSLVHNVTAGKRETILAQRTCLININDINFASAWFLVLCWRKKGNIEFATFKKKNKTQQNLQFPLKDVSGRGSKILSRQTTTTPHFELRVFKEINSSRNLHNFHNLTTFTKEFTKLY